MKLHNPHKGHKIESGLAYWLIDGSIQLPRSYSYHRVCSYIDNLEKVK